MPSAGSGRAGHLVLLLVIMNISLLAAGLALEYWLGQPRGVPEFNVHLIRLLGHPGADPVDRPGALKDRTAESPAPASPSACVKVTGFDQARYLELQAVLETAGIGPQQRMFLLDQSLGWWVFWPPEYEAGQREKAQQAIRAAGVRDAIPITKGVMTQAFSLGVFANEEQAVTHRNRLRSRGLDKAEHGPRPGVAEKEIHLVCMLSGEEQRQKLQAGLPVGVSMVAREECPEVEINPAPR